MKNIKLGIFLSLILIIASMVACGKSDESAKTTTSSPSATTAATTSTTNTAVTTFTSAKIEYDEKDIYTDYTTESYTDITLSGSTITANNDNVIMDGGIATITKSGTYVISGALTDGQIHINAPDETVRLVLNGADITCSTNAPILVEDAKKVFLSLAPDTENTLTDTDSSSSKIDESEVTAVIYSKADLVFNGSGTLNLQAKYKDAITGKDDVIFIEGSYIIQSTDDGIVAKDSLQIANGTFTITSKGDAMKCTNSEEDGKGYIYIAAGTFDISTEDDAIHGEQALQIDGGTFDITTCYEGLESPTITINDGDIHIVSSDDSINAADGTGTETHGGFGNSTGTCSLLIHGGSIAINSSGDGLDVNGSITMTGGTVLLNGPTNDGNGTLDFDSTFNITGGSLVAAGSSGMALAPTTDSTQYSIMMTYAATSLTEGTKVTLKSADDTTITSFTTAKECNNIVVSSPEIKNGETYTLYSNNVKVVSFETSESITYVNESGITTAPAGGMGGNRGGGGMGGGGMGGNRGGDMGGGDMPTRPQNN